LYFDKGYACVLVVDTLQMGRLLGQHHFEGRPDMRLQEMPARGRAIALADHDMGMYFRLVIIQGDITH
jgi:hypothetical protein